MGETGWQQEATQFKSKQKVRIYNFWKTVNEFEGFTHCRDINQGQQGKGNVYTRDFERQRVVLKAEQGQPRRVEEARDTASARCVWTMWTCGQCGGSWRGGLSKYGTSLNDDDPDIRSLKNSLKALLTGA